MTSVRRVEGASVMENPVVTVTAQLWRKVGGLEDFRASIFAIWAVKNHFEGFLYVYRQIGFHDGKMDIDYLGTQEFALRIGMK
jgi:hypothetical protein